MKDQVEDFKFRKEMDRAKEKMLADMEKNKVKAKMDSLAMERIKKREDELLQKKEEAMFKKKMDITRSKQFELGLLEAKAAGTSAALKNKVESKLLVETTAMVEKKRGKYDPKKDGPGQTAHTMGGNLLGVAMRQQPGWRAGV